MVGKDSTNPNPVHVETPEVKNVRHNIKKLLVVDDVGSIRKLLPAKLKRLAPEAVNPKRTLEPKPGPDQFCLFTVFHPRPLVFCPNPKP